MVNLATLAVAICNMKIHDEELANHSLHQPTVRMLQKTGNLCDSLELNIPSLV